MNILGFSAFYHDAAACLLQDGIIKNAVQEERFTRIKHDENFPIKSIAFCIEESKLNFDEIDYIVFYEKPFPKFERIFETYLAFAPVGFANFMASFSTWIKDKLFLKKKIIKLFYDNFNVNINNKLLFFSSDNFCKFSLIKVSSFILDSFISSFLIGNGK